MSAYVKPGEPRCGLISPEYELRTGVGARGIWRDNYACHSAPGHVGEHRSLHGGHWDRCCCTPDPDGTDWPEETCSGCDSHSDIDTRPVCDRHIDERDRAWRR